MFIRDLVNSGNIFYCMKNGEIVKDEFTEYYRIFINNRDAVYISLYFAGDFSLYLIIEITELKHKVYFASDISVGDEKLYLFPNLLRKIKKFIRATLVDHDEIEYTIIFNKIFKILTILTDTADNIEVNPCAMKSARKTSN
jgi:predicted DNA-binding protein YlxM (UPF0122 family)